MIIIALNCKAQTNLVPNPSFENFTWETYPSVCDTFCSWIDWYSPTNGTSDYFNKNDNCFLDDGDVPLNLFGYQNPKTGKAYWGFLSRYVTTPANISGYNSREYIQSKLLDSLKSGVKYCVNFYVSLADSAQYASDGISAYFSKTAISLYDSLDLYYILPYNPQISSPVIISDKTNWTLISGSFKAQGGEQYITMGNFRDDEHTDSLFVGGAIYQGTPYSYYYIDDVSVEECSPQDTSSLIFNVYPSLATNQIYIDYSNLEINKTHFLLYDICGRKVKEIEITLPTAQQSFDITRYSAGMYFYKLVINGEEEYRGKVVVRK